MKAILICTVLLGLPLSLSAFEMGISASRTPPVATIFYTKDSAQIRKTGMLYLLGQYIQRHTKEPTIYTVVNAGLIEKQLANNTLASHCYTNPKWVKLSSKSVLFSKPFMGNSEFLISRKPIPLIKKLSDLNHYTVGLIKNYHYPLLQKQIDKNLINVEYYHSATESFISLFRQDELDVIIFKEVI